MWHSYIVKFPFGFSRLILVHKCVYVPTVYKDSLCILDDHLAENEIYRSQLQMNCQR